MSKGQKQRALVHHLFMLEAGTAAGAGRDLIFL